MPPGLRGGGGGQAWPPRRRPHLMGQPVGARQAEEADEEGGGAGEVVVLGGERLVPEAQGILGLACLQGEGTQVGLEVAAQRIDAGQGGAGIPDEAEAARGEGLRSHRGHHAAGEVGEQHGVARCRR